jgi:hypothetical protein
MFCAGCKLGFTNLLEANGVAGTRIVSRRSCVFAALRIDVNEVLLRSSKWQKERIRHEHNPKSNEKTKRHGRCSNPERNFASRLRGWRAHHT